MTTPKSFAEESELKADEFVEKYPTMNGRLPHRPDVMKFCFDSGYTACLESQVMRGMYEAIKHSCWQLQNIGVKCKPLQKLKCQMCLAREAFEAARGEDGK